MSSSQTASTSFYAQLVNKPQYLQPVLEQTTIALDCLKKKLETHEDSVGLLPYLIHASVLLFLLRDMLAYEWVRQQEVFQQSPLPNKLRQTPALQQTLALLKSLPETAALSDTVAQLSDEALDVQKLREFRNHIVQWGIPGEVTYADEPFPLPVVSYQALAQSALEMGDKLISP